MSGGLREYWELPEINLPEGASGNGEFSQDFRAGLTKLNQDMQLVAVHGAPGEYQTLDSHRQNLIKAYQTANSIGDAAKNGQVMGAVAKIEQQTSDKAAKINAGREEWEKRQPAFDAAVVKIGELEDANHPTAPAFRKVSEAIQARAKGKDYQNANAAFDQLQPKLNEVAGDAQLAPPLDPKAEEPTPGLDGFDTGQVQAGAKDFIVNKVIKPVAGKAWDWITKEGLTTVVIENWTNKELSLSTKTLRHPNESKWVDEPPKQIMAAKGPNEPTKETMSVRTDKWIRGVSKADTSGFVVYEVVGTDKQRTFVKKAIKGKVVEQETKLVRAKVIIGWSRKGEGQLDEKETGTDLGWHHAKLQQVKGGTIIYRFTEEAQPKPKDPQSPETKKPDEPKAPADTKLKKPLEFTIIPFTVGKDDKLDKGGDLMQRAHEIWNDERLGEIKSAILQKLPAGQLKIEVHGYASNTDTAERNLDLSRRRANAVIKALNSVGVPLTAFTEPQPHGEWETKPPTDDKKQEKEEEEWRKVVVKVSQ